MRSAQLYLLADATTGLTAATGLTDLTPQHQHFLNQPIGKLIELNPLLTATTPAIKAGVPASMTPSSKVFSPTSKGLASRRVLITAIANVCLSVPTKVGKEESITPIVEMRN